MRKTIIGVAAAVAGLGAAQLQAADQPAETTTLNGRAYVDLTNVSFDNDGVTPANSPNGTGVDVKRFYLVATHTFDSTWSANLTTDFNYTSATGETQLFVKKAFVQAKLSDALWARLGSTDMPWVPMDEGLYGYRYVEKVLVDRIGYGTSADWGLHAGGKSANGMFSYALSEVNGGGYKNPTRSNSMDTELRISVVPVKGLTIAAGFYSGKLGQDFKNLAAASVPRTSTRLDALVAYVAPNFKVGAEYFSADDWKILSSKPSDKADGYSAWASFNFTPKVAGFARYDNVKPSKTIASRVEENYYNAGVAFKPRKNIELSVAYKHDEVKYGAFKTGDVTIGTATGTKGKYDEVGVWAVVDF